MTKEDIIFMARKAGFEIDCCSLEWHDRIERFASLVAEHERDRYAEKFAELIVRECAKVADIADEPVAWMYEWDGKKHLTFTDQRLIEKAHPHFNKSIPLYTTPPQRKPLSSEDIEQCCYEADSVTDDHCQTWKWTEEFAKAIEAAHGIKP